MSPRVLSCVCLLCAFSFGCTKPIEIGQTCYDTQECRSGVCATTVYGKVCMNTCNIDIVRCEGGEACLLGGEIPQDGGVGGAGGAGGIAGAGGMGGTAGAGGMGGTAGAGGMGGTAGAGGMGGTAGAGGMGGTAGAGGTGGMAGVGGMDSGVPDAGMDGGVDGGTDMWFCLPANIVTAPEEVLPDGIPLGGICTYSVDCFRGGVCVCGEGQNCDLEDEDRNGPICVEICNSGTVNQCPLQQACVDLGMGRGFCDLSTSQSN